MYNVCVHNSLPTSAILALGLLKKKERRRKKMNNFAFVAKTLFGYLALRKRILAVLKVATNADATVENAYTVKSAWKYETAKKTGVFVGTASETPYRHVFSQSWHCCMILCKRSSSIHNPSYWWVNDILTQRRLKLGRLSVAAILFSSHPYM